MPQIAILSTQNKFVSAQPVSTTHPHGAMIADRNRLLGWETYFVEAGHDPKGISLKSSHNKYVSVQGDSDHAIHVNRDQALGWETLFVVMTQDGRCAFRTIHGTYLSAPVPVDKLMTGNASEIHGWEEFYIIPLNDQGHPANGVDVEEDGFIVKLINECLNDPLGCYKKIREIVGFIDGFSETEPDCPQPEIPSDLPVDKEDDL